MAEIERSDIIIEGNTATWEISLQGDVSGTYTGKFRFKCILSPTHKIAANREYRELLGNNPTLTPEYESNLAYALTQLKYRVLEAPPFWSATQNSTGYAGDIADTNVIMAVLDAAVEAEIKYKRLLKKRTEDSLERAKKAAERLLQQQDEEVDEDQDEEDDN